MFIEKYHQKRGLRYMRVSDHKKASHHFEKALLLNDSSTNYYNYSVVLISDNKHRQAISYLEQITEKHADDLLIAATLCECYLVAREWEKAEDYLSYLSNKFPESILIKKMYDISQDSILREKYATGKEYFYKSSDLLNTKDFDGAIDMIKNAIDLDELNSTYYYFASVILLMAKSPKEEVSSYLEKAVMLSPQNEQYKKVLRFVKTKYKP
jgi:tetratricopeptide (TPR) repeat protein